MLKSIGALHESSARSSDLGVWVRKFPGMGYSCGTIPDLHRSLNSNDSSKLFETTSRVLPVGRYHLRAFDLPPLGIEEAARVCSASYRTLLGGVDPREISLSLSNDSLAFNTAVQLGGFNSGSPDTTSRYLSATTSECSKSQNSAPKDLSGFVPSALAIERSLKTIFKRAQTNDGLVIIQAEGGFLFYHRENGQTIYSRAVPSPNHSSEALIHSSVSGIAKILRSRECTGKAPNKDIALSFFGSDELALSLQSCMDDKTPFVNFSRLFPVSPFSELSHAGTFPIDQTAAALWGLPALGRRVKMPLARAAEIGKPRRLSARLAFVAFLVMSMILGFLRIEVAKNRNAAKGQGIRTKEVFSKFMRGHRMVDPVFQMEREISLRGMDDSSAEGLLSRLVDVLSNIPEGCLILSVDIDDGMASLSGTARDFTTLGQLRRHLSKFTETSPDLSVKRDGTGKISFKAAFQLASEKVIRTGKES